MELDVKSTYAAWTEARARYEATQQVVAQVETGLRLARSRYNSGAAPQLDVLRSQVALTQARINVLTAEHDLARTLADLRRAMGDYGRYLVAE